MDCELASVILSNRRGSQSGNHLPLSRERAITSGDTEDEGIVVDQVFGSQDGIVRLGWGVK